jgi:PAS domain S-box-containing protein
VVHGWRFDRLHPDAYRMLVEGAPAILYIDRPDEPSTNLYTSPQVVELLGFSVDEWRSDPDLWQRQLNDDDRDRVMKAHRISNERGERFLEEYRFTTKDGRELWIRDEAAPVRGDDGTLLYWRGVMLDITERKEAEEKLRWSLDVLRKTLQQRRELAARLETAQEEERRRIAADIHDDPIQVMSAVDMRLQLLAQDPSHVTPEDLRSIERDMREAIERLRNLLFELRPAALERDGLATALEIYVEHTARTTGWTGEVRDGLEREPSPDVRVLLYRIAQEAIANARKHASAGHVAIELATAGEGVSMRVSDDGVGFETEVLAAPEPGHIGLSTIVERAELAGGWARVHSAPGRGTTVECWLPLGPGLNHAIG